MDSVICESWLSIFLNGSLLTELPLTDRDVEDLVMGILYTEGYLKAGDSPRIIHEGSICRVTIEREVQVRSLRDLLDCASSRIELDEAVIPQESGFLKTPEQILSLLAEFQKLPSVYHDTGGVHMAAFAKDSILHWADDISRRNAVDKVIGKGFRSGATLKDGFLITSGRISSDMVQRMLKVEIPMIVSLSAPTEKAVDMAKHYGITVCGFARGFRVNVYTGAERLGLEEI